MKGFYFSLGLLVCLITASSGVQAKPQVRSSTLLTDGSVRIHGVVLGPFADPAVMGEARLSPKLHRPALLCSPSADGTGVLFRSGPSSEGSKVARPSPSRARRSISSQVR